MLARDLWMVDRFTAWYFLRSALLVMRLEIRKKVAPAPKIVNCFLRLWNCSSGVRDAGDGDD